MARIKLQNILFIDIETVPIRYNYNELDANATKLWDKKWAYNAEIDPQEQYVKAGIYAEFAQVICIGIGYFNEGSFRVKTISGSDEKEVLTEFATIMNTHFSTKDHYLCAHNGKEFDYPFLCRRFIINGLPLPKNMQLQGLKPWEVKHLDTMELWKFGDIKNFTSLDLLAYILNIPSPKDNMDGGQVAKVYYEEHDLEKIANYCSKDVVTVARIYQRFNGLDYVTDDAIIYT